MTSIVLKTACLFVLILLLFGCRGGNKTQPSATEPEQRGTRDATAGTAQPENTTGAKGRECPANAKCTRDQHGRIITEKGAIPGREGRYRRTYRYDGRGNLAEELSVSGFEASIGPFKMKKVYSYDARSRRVSRAEESRSNWKPNGASRACKYNPPCSAPFSNCKEECGEWQAKPRHRQD